MAKEDGRLIEPRNVYGDSSMVLDIPNNASCLGVAECFAYWLGNRDRDLDVRGVERVRKYDGGTSVMFGLGELAEACLGSFTPKALVDELRPLMSPDVYQSEALLMRMGEFEKHNSAIVLAHPDIRRYDDHTCMTMPTRYFCPINMRHDVFMWEMARRVPKGTSSSTRHTSVRAAKMGRVVCDTAYFPVPNGVSLNVLREALLENRDFPIHTYVESGLDAPNFDPFYLLGEFPEIDVSGVEVCDKA